MKNSMGSLAFLVAVGISIFGALIHWVAPLVGPEWYAFLTAPNWVVESARKGTMDAPVGAVVIGFLMFSCGLYALAGAGLIRRLPLMKTGLIVIATICLLRGLLLTPFLVMVPERLSAFDITASMVWLVAGIAFLIGTVKRWPLLG